MVSGMEVRESVSNCAPILRASNIKKYFGNLKVLDGVDFSVSEREILGIAGPNGAGKTTLFNLISGLLPLTAGDIFFREERITNLKPHRVCSLGISRTFQMPVIFPTLTVRENMKVGGIFGNKGASKKAVVELIDDILNLLQLEHLQNSLAENLSLYEKKTAMLATALTTSPKLLLLDEPAAGLSRGEIEHFMEIISRLNREYDITIMIIEHLIDWLRYVSEKMLIIHNGTVMAYGVPEEVVNDQSVVEIYIGRTHDRPQS
jgi:branched-chain amino acid transport system ATP-binding protein